MSHKWTKTVDDDQDDEDLIPRYKLSEVRDQLQTARERVDQLTKERNHAEMRLREYNARVRVLKMAHTEAIAGMLAGCSGITITQQGLVLIASQCLYFHRAKQRISGERWRSRETPTRLER